MGNIVVDEFLERLSGNAVKLYLFLLCRSDEGTNIYEPATRDKLRFSQQEYDDAANELNEYGLISYEKGQYLEITANENLMENKQKKIDRDFCNLKAQDNFDDDYKTVLQTINREFFAGKMTVTWFDFSDKCIKEYGFLPETLYLLFHECDQFKDRSSTGYRSYVEKVAESWYRQKIKTPEDVSAMTEKWNGKMAFVKFVSKKLSFSRNFTEAEQNTIMSWFDAGISEEMLSVILDDTNRVAAMTIEKINNEITLWNENGIKTKEAAEEFKKNKKSQKTEKKQGGNQAHFDNERSYSNQELDMLLNRDKNGGRK